VTYDQWIETFLKTFVSPHERTAATLALRAFVAAIVSDKRRIRKR
jgi:hypothetical protein